MAAIKADCVTCPVHEEFAKRLDERWEARVAEQDKINETLSSKMDKMAGKVYLAFGGIAVLFVVIQIVGPILVRHFTTH